MAFREHYVSAALDTYVTRQHCARPSYTRRTESGPFVGHMGSSYIYPLNFELGVGKERSTDAVSTFVLDLVSFQRLLQVPFNHFRSLLSYSTRGQIMFTQYDNKIWY